jgi:hypothetical protein
MIITDYIKLQQYTKRQQAFPGRRQHAHGIAKGAVEYYEVAGHSWPTMEEIAAVALQPSALLFAEGGR